MLCPLHKGDLLGQTWHTFLLAVEVGICAWLVSTQSRAMKTSATCHGPAFTTLPHIPIINSLMITSLTREALLLLDSGCCGVKPTERSAGTNLTLWGLPKYGCESTPWCSNGPPEDGPWSDNVALQGLGWSMGAGEAPSICALVFRCQLKCWSGELVGKVGSTQTLHLHLCPLRCLSRGSMTFPSFGSCSVWERQLWSVQHQTSQAVQTNVRNSKGPSVQGRRESLETMS